MYQLVAVECAVNVFDNSEFFQFRAYRLGNAFWRGGWKCWGGLRRIPQAEEQILERVEEEHLSTCS